MTQETVFACDALGDLYRYSEQLLRANKELLAWCDLLEAEIAALKTVLHSISLGSQNSMTTKEDLGAAARKALAALVGEE